MSEVQKNLPRQGLKLWLNCLDSTLLALTSAIIPVRLLPSTERYGDRTDSAAWTGDDPAPRDTPRCSHGVLRRLWRQESPTERRSTTPR